MRKPHTCDYCDKKATWDVVYFADGSGARFTCGRHINQAASEVLAGTTVPTYASLKLRPIKQS